MVYRVLKKESGEATVVRSTHVRTLPMVDAALSKDDSALKSGDYFHYVSIVEGDMVEANEHNSNEWYKIGEDEFVAKLDCEKYSLKHTH